MWKKLAVTATLLILTWAVAGYRLFVAPTQQTPEHVDAIVVLAGSGAERLPKGIELLESGVAPLLFVSNPGDSGNPAATELCQDPPSGIECFTPDDNSTRGEARSIGALTLAHDLRSVLVVTSTYHLTRARVLVGQATDITIYGVSSETSLPASVWLSQMARETFALVDSLLRPEDGIA